MSARSATGRNSGRKNRDSISSAQTTISETAPLPNTFHYWNGDEYTGQFAILRDKQKLAMHGSGVYRTSDGELYEGTWDNDCLKGHCQITFPDKSVFSGVLSEMIIEGFGTYKFKEKVEIEGEFVNNTLTGNAYLNDPNRHKWKGRVEKNGSSVTFYPLHAYWQSVLNLPSKNFQLYYGQGEEEQDNIWEDVY